MVAGRIENGCASSRKPSGVWQVVRSFVLAVEHSPVGLPQYRSRLCSSCEVKSATSGKAELALPTLAIAEVPVAELPVADRLLLWENSQLVKHRVQHEATLKNEDKNDAAQPEATDPYAGKVLIEK